MGLKNRFINFAPPCIGKDEIREVMDTLQSDWITTGPKTKRFEALFSNYVQAPQALAVSSATAALHAGLLALGVGPGDFVITTPMTFCSTVHVIEQTGARFILADVEEDTLNIDPYQIERILGKQKLVRQRCKVILPVHYGGHPCEMRAIMALAKRYHLKVLEDAAHAMPARYDGRMIGAIGDATAFSFYATKNLTTGEGGMLTASASIIAKARPYTLHGIDRDVWNRYSNKGSWYYEVVERGYKYNMTDIQAAIGIHQLKKITGFHKKRQRIARSYSRSFACNDLITPPVERPNSQNAWHLYVIRLNKRINRDRFIQELRRKNIGSSVHFIPIHIHPYFKKRYQFKPLDYPVAYRAYEQIVSLPIHPRMSDPDVQYVSDAVNEISHKLCR